MGKVVEQGKGSPGFLRAAGQTVRRLVEGAQLQSGADTACPLPREGREQWPRHAPSVLP